MAGWYKSEIEAILPRKRPMDRLHDVLVKFAEKELS